MSTPDQQNPWLFHLGVPLLAADAADSHSFESKKLINPGGFIDPGQYKNHIW